jgi:imidazole glycerol-phosphate synthase subunit HisH
MPTIAVIDYDMGNLHSACKGLEQVGGNPQLAETAQQIAAADAIVLPGVGSFDPAVQHLRSRDLELPLKQAIASGKPFLGICLGLQILFDRSDEGTEPGLGIIPGHVRKFRSEPNITIPHMGWNQIQLTQPDCPLWQNLPNSWLYFVHSYYVSPTDANVTAATITHGTQIITAAIAQDNIMAVQFHPEKSSIAGLKLLSNFVELVNQQMLVRA